MRDVLEYAQACLDTLENSSSWRKSLWVADPFICLLVVQISLDLLRTLPMGGGEQTAHTYLEFRLDAIDLPAKMLNRIIILGPQLFLVSLHDISKGLLLRHWVIQEFFLCIYAVFAGQTAVKSFQSDVLPGDRRQLVTSPCPRGVFILVAR